MKKCGNKNPVVLDNIQKKTLSYVVWEEASLEEEITTCIEFFFSVLDHAENSNYSLIIHFYLYAEKLPIKFITFVTQSLKKPLRNLVTNVIEVKMTIGIGRRSYWTVVYYESQSSLFKNLTYLCCLFIYILISNTYLVGRIKPWVE